MVSSAADRLCFPARLLPVDRLGIRHISQQYVVPDKKGQKLLYVELQNAVYGTLKVPLLLYQKLVEHFMRAGFKLNPYDPCVVKK